MRNCAPSFRGLLMVVGIALMIGAGVLVQSPDASAGVGLCVVPALCSVNCDGSPEPLNGCGTLICRPPGVTNCAGCNFKLNPGNMSTCYCD